MTKEHAPWNEDVEEHYDKKLEEIEADHFKLTDDFSDLVLFLIESSALDEWTKEKLRIRFFNPRI